jgi:nucleoside-diphosphate-sugar epimerase
VMGSGSTSRDFLYIEDFLDIVAKTLAYEARAPGVAVLNVGSGVQVTIDALCEHMERLTGMAITRRACEARPVDPPQVLLDSSRAGELLSWKARVLIEEGLRLTWQWWKSQP